jgi:putative endonuclease
MNDDPSPKAGGWFVYLLRCQDGSLYTGIARDVCARMEQHNAGRGAKYTKGRSPVELLVARGPMPRGEALRLEVQTKRQKRSAKQAFLTDLVGFGAGIS